ncbi:phytanoyl-CoA dioxygenase family protein [Undibacterium squillarum]|uniref:phytanoyl-CoA dioxygenase family protein n=1 Tax=Undibacterium squillarum TaxID=1131567 RepID=UPI0035AF93FE
MPALHLQRQGVAHIPAVLSAAACAQLETPVLQAANRGGTRCMLDQPWCAALADELRNHPLLQTLLGDNDHAVQCTYFEKSASRNWLVSLHQDLSIPVRQKCAHPALSGWSEKEGMLFVQPPASVLANMLALRLHLDACGIRDGALAVVPGSHLQGRQTPEQAIASREQLGQILCTAARGDIIAMRPLTLHASSKASGHSQRRVLHFVFGPRSLPYGLAWANS